MTQSAHTRCWGVLLAFGLQLPAVPPPSPPAGPSVPPPVTRPAPSAPWAPVWSHAVETTTELQLALSRDFVFTAGPGAPVEARSSATGTVAWRHALASWQALSSTDTLALGVSGNHAYALDAATGQTRWVTETTGANTRLQVNGTHLLMVSDTDLLLREVDTGTPLWRAAIAAPPSAPAALGADVVVISQQDGMVLAFERTSGAPRWQTKLTSVPRALTAVAPIVYAGLANGFFCALDIRSGSERWCAPLRVPMAGPPAVDGDLVRVALLDNSLRSFHRLNGNMAQPGTLGHRPASGPWLTGAAIVVPLTTGEFVVVDRTSGRTLQRLSVPGATASHLLERAAISDDGRLLASLTIAPSGERRLSTYRPRSTALPITKTMPPGTGVTLRPPPAARPVTPGARPPAPRPFPGSR